MKSSFSENTKDLEKNEIETRTNLEEMN